MNKFDWSRLDYLYAYVQGKTKRVVNVEHTPYTTTILTLDDDTKETVYTSSGCGWSDVNQQRDRSDAIYIFRKDKDVAKTKEVMKSAPPKPVAPVINADEIFAKELRDAAIAYNAALTKLQNRGYKIYGSELPGASERELYVYTITKIVKTETIERII